MPFRNPTELDGFVTPAAVRSLIATFELSAAQSAIAWELFRGYAAKVDALDREAAKAIDEAVIRRMTAPTRRRLFQEAQR